MTFDLGLPLPCGQDLGVSRFPKEKQVFDTAKAHFLAQEGDFRNSLAFRNWTAQQSRYSFVGRRTKRLEAKV
jgi:hypothetical protein